jgi:hypothetical protein
MLDTETGELLRERRELGVPCSLVPELMHTLTVRRGADPTRLALRRYRPNPAARAELPNFYIADTGTISPRAERIVAGVDRHSVLKPQRSIDGLVISPEIRYLSARKLREIFHGPRRRRFWCSMGQCVFAAQRARLPG